MNLEVKNLKVTRGRNEILKGVDCTFKEGKITCILGRNGCGKTTLVKELVRLYAPKVSMSYVAQDTFGQLNLSVYDTVAIGRYNKSRFFSGPTPEDVSKIDAALELMELKGKEKRIFDTLSGGEKQRCMAARAICQDPEWMIFDEPSSNLDAVHSRKITSAVKALNGEGKSVILVMHDINEASRVADEFVLMKDGLVYEVCGKLNAQNLSLVYEVEFGTADVNGQPFFFVK